MTRTFSGEDQRKDALFNAWIDYLTLTHVKFGDTVFDEIFEGTVVISDISKNKISYRLSDGRCLRRIPIAPEVSRHSCRTDSMYIALGRIGSEWWTLDVISIGSLLSGEQVHISYNPIYVNRDAFSSSVH